MSHNLSDAAGCQKEALIPRVWRPVGVSSATQQLDHGFITHFGIICLLRQSVFPSGSLSEIKMLVLSSEASCFWKDMSTFSLQMSAWHSQIFP